MQQLNVLILLGDGVTWFEQTDINSGVISDFTVSQTVDSFDCNKRRYSVRENVQLNCFSFLT